MPGVNELSHYSNKRRTNFDTFTVEVYLNKFGFKMEMMATAAQWFILFYGYFSSF